MLQTSDTVYIHYQRELETFMFRRLSSFSEIYGESLSPKLGLLHYIASSEA
jgi:hypothetical protein